MIEVRGWPGAVGLTPEPALDPLEDLLECRFPGPTPQSF